MQTLPTVCSWGGVRSSSCRSGAPSGRVLRERLFPRRRFAVAPSGDVGRAFDRGVVERSRMSRCLRSSGRCRRWRTSRSCSSRRGTRWGAVISQDRAVLFENGRFTKRPDGDGSGGATFLEADRAADRLRAYGYSPNSTGWSARRRRCCSRRRRTGIAPWRWRGRGPCAAGRSCSPIRRSAASPAGGRRHRAPPGAVRKRGDRPALGVLGCRTSRIG